MDASFQQIITSFLSQRTKKPLLVIIGPTASGKTSLSIEIARNLKIQGQVAHVINADSRQFYKGFDIGTAKITHAEMQGVPHHLLSVLSPDKESSIAWFQSEASAVIQNCHARGILPLLVGGSMLYVSALIDGFQPGPKGDVALRQRLSEEYAFDEGQALWQRLQAVDPEAAARIPSSNPQYLIRAMELVELTGKPHAERATLRKEPGYDLRIIGVKRSKQDLKERILKRIEAMFQNGWMEEVMALEREGYGEQTPAMLSFGYREILSWLKTPAASRCSLRELHASIARSSLQYAKRHDTWWRRDPRVHWITL